MRAQRVAETLSKLGSFKRLEQLTASEDAGSSVLPVIAEAFKRVRGRRAVSVISLSVSAVL